MSIEHLTPTQLRKAADLQEQIAKLQDQLAGIISVGGKTHTPAEAAKPAKRKMSPAHIAKIRAAQKLRWAKVNAAKVKPVAAKAPKKGGMSAAGRANIAAAAKARWAKVNAAKSVAAPKLAEKPVVAEKPAVKTTSSKPAKRKISPEGIARIKAAQKARWAAT
jgi:hypothetical protein